MNRTFYNQTNFPLSGMTSNKPSENNNSDSESCVDPFAEWAKNNSSSEEKDITQLTKLLYDRGIISTLDKLSVLDCSYSGDDNYSITGFWKGNSFTVERNIARQSIL